MELIVDNSDQSVADTARALWQEGRDRVAIAGALLDLAQRMTGHPCPDAAIEILARVGGREAATEAVKDALLLLARR